MPESTERQGDELMVFATNMLQVFQEEMPMLDLFLYRRQTRS